MVQEKKRPEPVQICSVNSWSFDVMGWGPWTSAAPPIGLSSAGRATTNVLRGRPVLATFQINLRCKDRYEMSREEIRRTFQKSAR